MTDVLERAHPAGTWSLPSGGGDLGAMMGDHDWSTSPLGSPATWPSSLQSIARLMLSSKFPMFVAWGPELGFLYNDPYAEILGAKHPDALGRRFRDVWSEIWSDISPLVDTALAGEATWSEDLPLTVNRKGYDEQTWFTFSYSPVRDESGRVAGMFCACTETTEKVLSAKRQARSEVALRTEEERLLFALDAGGLGAWDLDLQTWVLTTSPHCREIFGRKADEPFTYEDLREVVHPEDRERQAVAQNAAVEEGKDYNIDYRVIWPGGQVRWVNVRGRPVYSDDGKPLLMAGVSIDINHRMLADLHQRLLIDELNHRVKNTLSTIQSIAMQTFRTENGIGAPPEQRELFESRLIALSKVHDVLTRENWEGARLRDVVLEAVAAHCGGDQNAFTVQGPDPRLPPKMALSLSMALHELCTNAAKYGSLSVPNGRVSIRWNVEESGADSRRLTLRWEEEGGPTVSAPTRKGFGSRLIERQLARELRGTVRLDYAPSGVICTLEAPLGDAAPGTAQLLAAASVQ